MQQENEETTEVVKIGILDSVVLLASGVALPTFDVGSDLLFSFRLLTGTSDGRTLVLPNLGRTGFCFYRTSDGPGFLLPNPGRTGFLPRTKFGRMGELFMHVYTTCSKWEILTIIGS